MRVDRAVALQMETDRKSGYLAARHDMRQRGSVVSGRTRVAIVTFHPQLRFHDDGALNQHVISPSLCVCARTTDCSTPPHNNRVRDVRQSEQSSTIIIGRWSLAVIFSLRSYDATSPRRF